MSGLIIMDSLIAATAQYLIVLIPVAAAVIWLYLPRQDEVGLAAHVHHGQDIVAGLLIAVVAVVAVGVAAAIWRWARPRRPRRLAELASV
ncbi:MAG: hypothetical protein ACYDDU_13390 [Dermatophilaceae bacterium]